MDSSRYTLYVHPRFPPSVELKQKVRKRRLPIRIVERDFPAHIVGVPTLADNSDYVLFQGTNAINKVEALPPAPPELAHTAKPSTGPPPNDQEEMGSFTIDPSTGLPVADVPTDNAPASLSGSKMGLGQLPNNPDFDDEEGETEGTIGDSDIQRLLAERDRMLQEARADIMKKNPQAALQAQAVS